ncbi:MAG: NTP transferase domain-containing protein [Candidatus Binatia bacterium]
MIAAIVLSAGESRRMGSPKALLPIGERPFAERIVTVLKATKVGKIVVVLGHNAEEIASKIVHLPITVVINKDYAKGQLSSLVVAIRSLEAEEVDGALVHLVDHPFLSPALVNHMIDRFYESKKLIVIPRHKGQRGHPVVFSSRLFPELLSTPLDQGAKAVVHAHRDETLEIETDEAGVTIDIDTPEEYRQHVGRK